MIHLANSDEQIFYDCAVEKNPAHTGLDDLLQEHAEEQRQRMLLYHYESAAAGAVLERSGFAVAYQGTVYTPGAAKWVA